MGKPDLIENPILTLIVMFSTKNLFFLPDSKRNQKNF